MVETNQRFCVIDMKRTGGRIKSKCKSKNLNASILQQIFGFGTPAAIYKWWSGKSLPSTDNLLILAEFLGTTVEDLIVFDIQS